MPEYTAPGVYVEETGFRAASIEGVGTGTVAFVGPTRKGPHRTGANATEAPELLTSFREFEQICGGLADLDLGPGVPTTNFLAHAVLAYFNEGGSRLYVARVLGAGAATARAVVTGSVGSEAAAAVASPEDIVLQSNSPGACGNGRILVCEVATAVSEAEMASSPQGSLLRTVAEGTASYHVKLGASWRDADNLEGPVGVVTTLAAHAPHVITLQIKATDGDGNSETYGDLGLHCSHPRWLGHALAPSPSHRGGPSLNPFAILIGESVSPLDLRNGLFANAVANAAGRPERAWALTGGSDGGEPLAKDYALALASIASLEDVCTVAAPGSSAYSVASADNPRAIANALIDHAERRRAYRMAVLDTPQGLTPDAARNYRGLFDSQCAAMYYPWVVVANPLARPGRADTAAELSLPPSGFVTGIYARNDAERGVHTAPANQVVRGALRFEFDVNAAQQELLNQAGVNCLRFFSGRGHRVWGARLISSDPEWKYVASRRYFNYLEASIDRGTQWAVFEPNGERLWANMCQTVTEFLHNEWRNGALLGAAVDQAFFVRCDRSTMSLNELDKGQLVCLIGVATLKPAEFMIFRIGQKTADARE